MIKQDIDKALAALTGASRYFGPIVTALNQADEVLAVLSHAIKHKDALEKDVAAAKATLEGYESRVAELAAQEATAGDGVKLAQAQATLDLENTARDCAAQVKAAKDAAAEAIKKHNARQAAHEAACTAVIEATTKESTEVVSALTLKKDALQAEVALWEQKLVDARAQVQQLAVSLAG